MRARITKLRRQPLLAALPLLLAALITPACPGTSNAGGLSGTYEAKDAEGSMTLEFKGDNKVVMTMMADGNQVDRGEAGYMIDGNKVTIQSPGGMPLTLVRNGDALDGNVMGEILHFTKK